MNLTIQQLKNEVLKHVSADWVRENYGKLTLKQSWQDAYDRCKEYAVAKADQAVETFTEAANEVIDTASLLMEQAGIALQDTIAETLTYDNLTAFTFSATATAKKVFWTIAKGVYIACCFAYYLGQAFGKDYYKVRQINAEMELEDLQRPIIKRPNFETLTLKELKAHCEAW